MGVEATIGGALGGGGSRTEPRAFRSALQAFHAGHHDHAIAEFTAALAEAPQHAPSRYMLARALVVQSRFEEARQALQSLLVQGGEKAEYHALLATCEDKTNRRAAAIESLGRAVAIRNNVPAWKRRLIKLLIQNGQISEAAAILGQLCALPDAHPYDLALLAKIATSSGKLEAKSHTETTADIAQRGLLAAQEGRHKEAVSDLQAALAREPKQTAWRFALSRSLHAQGNIETARSELLRLTSCADCQPQWQALLADCESKLGHHAIAIDLLQKALRKRPNVDGWRKKLATLLCQVERFAEAEPLLISLCEASNVRPHELILLAQIHRQNGAWSEAANLFVRAIGGKKNPPVQWRAMEAECRRRTKDAYAAENLPPGEATASFYDELYRGSDAYAATAEESDYLPVWECIIERLAATSAQRVIDIGCGPGQFAALLLSRLPQIIYTGIDFSPVAVEQGQARCRQARFVNADVVRSDVLDKLQYDIVICTEFLEHVDRDLSVLQRLKPGVLFLGSVPNFGSFSHVRHFSSTADVARRYGQFFRSLTVRPIAIGKDRILFLFMGVVGEFPETLVVPSDSLAADEPAQAKRHWSAVTFDFYKEDRPWSHDMAARVVALAPERVFEFGCNAGGNLATIRAMNSTVELFGIDVNEAAVKFAVERGLNGCGVGDETTLAAMPSGSFDVVFTVSVLDHLPNPEPTLSHLIRLARKAVILHEPWIGIEGHVVKNRHRSTNQVITTTPFSYSWDYERLCREIAPHWHLTSEKAPIPTNLGKFYWRYTLVRVCSE